MSELAFDNLRFVDDNDFYWEFVYIESHDLYKIRGVEDDTPDGGYWLDGNSILELLESASRILRDGGYIE